MSKWVSEFTPGVPQAGDTIGWTKKNQKIFEMRDTREWVYAGGDYDHHVAYHRQFCRDWKTMIADEPPTISEHHFHPRPTPLDLKHNEWQEKGQETSWFKPQPGNDGQGEVTTGAWTNCICKTKTLRWIFIFNIRTKQFEWIGSECRSIMENQKICGGCKKVCHRNTKKINGEYENRCNACKKVKATKKKCGCGRPKKEYFPVCPRCYYKSV